MQGEESNVRPAEQVGDGCVEASAASLVGGQPQEMRRLPTVQLILRGFIKPTAAMRASAGPVLAVTPNTKS